MVILETDDAILNRALVATARHYGVPVSVPDQIDLCSFIWRRLLIARRLRTAFGFTGALLADGHIIPDQADYLFRCGFTYAMVTPDRFGDWQQAHRFIQIHFQTMPDSRQSRLDQWSHES